MSKKNRLTLNKNAKGAAMPLLRGLLVEQENVTADLNGRRLTNKAGCVSVVSPLKTLKLNTTLSDQEVGRVGIRAPLKPIDLKGYVTHQRGGRAPILVSPPKTPPAAVAAAYKKDSSRDKATTVGVSRKNISHKKNYMCINLFFSTSRAAVENV